MEVSKGTISVVTNMVKQLVRTDGAYHVLFLNSWRYQVTYGDKSRTFKNIEKGEFENLMRFVEAKDIAVRNKPVRVRCLGIY